MLRQIPQNVSRKQLAELLFDEFYDISCKKQNLKKSSGSDVFMNRSLQGDVVVTDSKKRLSDNFKKDHFKAQSKSSYTDQENDDDQILHATYSNSFESPSQRITHRFAQPAPRQAVARGHTSNTEEARDEDGACCVEAPSESVIHETAVNIARMGDELDANYKKRLEEVSDKVADSLNQTGSSLTYAAFSSLLSSLIPQDLSIGAYFFVMHLSVQLIWKVGFYVVPLLRRYVSEEFAQEAETAVQQQQQQQEQQHDN